MTILLLTDGITPFVKGGLQRHSQLVAEHLARKGNRILLYHYSESKSVPDLEEAFTPEASKNIKQVWFHYSDTGVLPGHYLRTQKRVSEQYLDAFMHQKHEADFIYTKGFMGWAFLKGRHVHGIKAPIAVKFHGMNMFQSQPDWKGELVKFMLRPPTKYILKNADYIFTYGGKITEITARLIDDPSKIIEIPSGIDKERMRPKAEIGLNEGSRKFLFVGRFDRLKGLPELYKAVESIRPERGVSFTIVGPIPDEKRLINSLVSYTGEINDVHDISNIYDVHDILICPSFSEGMPNVIMEAMARGLAIIATDVGATSLLVSEENGILLESPTPESILLALNRMIDDSDTKIMEQKKTSRNRIDEFVWETIGDKLNEAIRPLL